MSQRQRYLKLLSGVAPAGIAGLALLLGSSTAAPARPDPAGWQPRPSQPASVSERLAAIRDAASILAEQDAAKLEGRDLRLAWGNWWRNWGGWRRWGGWGWPNWNNWRNWNNWWRNW